MRTRLLMLLFVLVLALACRSSATDTPVPSLEDQIRTLLPGLGIDFEDGAEQQSEQYGVRRFSYSSAPREKWPYGTGFAIWSHASGQVLWIYQHHGDFPPHAVHWADFDGDSRPDLFFHAGSEDVFTTHMYVNRVNSSKFDLAQFAQAYENNDVYAIVTDIDSNGQPELLVPEPYLPAEDACADTFREYATVNPEWVAEYSRITGEFSRVNFRGSPPHEYDTLGLFSKVQLVSFGRAPASEARRKHLKLRSAMLARALLVLPEPCRTRAEETREHVAKLTQGVMEKRRAWRRH